MSSTSGCTGVSCVDLSASRRITRLGAVVLAAASLAACAQSSVVRQSEWRSTGTSRQAAIEHPRRPAVAAIAPQSIAPKWITPKSTTPKSVATAPRSIVRRQEPAEPDKNAAGTPRVSQGLASFYSYDTQTASGEKFDARELTAAHPSLPFGTRLRVTNVTTGRSVTVRVNDRGPYVAGRVVDVSHSAAEELGMVGQGVAKVKLDVVQ
jgi:rare lipoprotein A